MNIPSGAAAGIGPCLRAYLPWGLLCFACYLPAIAGPLQFDDLHLFVHSGPVQAVREGRDLRMQAYPRGVVDLSCIADVVLWGGPDGTIAAEGPHLTNLLIHLLNGWCVLFLLEGILRARGEPHALSLAALLAGAFLLHPLQTESVAYLSGRSESLAGFALLCGVLPWARGGLAPRARWAWTFLCCGVSLCAKESGILTVPAALLVGRLTGRSDTRGAVRALLALVLVGALAGVPGHVASHVRYLGGARAAYDWYLPTQAGVVALYARKAAWPVRQNLDADVDYSLWTLPPPTDGAMGRWGRLLEAIGLASFHPRPTPSGIGTAWRWGWWAVLAAEVAVVAALWILRRRIPYAAHGGAWFLLLLTPTVLIPLQDVSFEHRMYMPLLGLLLACVAAVRAGLTSRAGRIALAAALACLAALCASRAAVWGGRGLWALTVLESPRKSRPHNNLGRESILQGSPERSRRGYLRALANSHQLHGVQLIYRNLAQNLRDLGDPASAAGVIAQGVRRGEIPGDVRLDLRMLEGHLWREAGRHEPAAEAFAWVVEALSSPGGDAGTGARLLERRARARAALAGEILALGSPRAAVVQYEIACALDPEDAESWSGLGRARAEAGDARGAEEAYLRAIGIAPRSVAPRLNLSALYRRQGDVPRALAEMDVARNLAPDEPAVLLEAGDLLVESGRAREGLPLLRRVVAAAPADPVARLALARALEGVEGALPALGALEDAMSDGVWDRALRDDLARRCAEIGDAAREREVRALPETPP